MLKVGDIVVIIKNEEYFTPQQFFNSVGIIKKIRNLLTFKILVEIFGYNENENEFGFHESELKLIKTNKRLK